MPKSSEKYQIYAETAEEIGRTIMAELHNDVPELRDECYILGSIRRGNAIVGDIDLMMFHDNPEEVAPKIEESLTRQRLWRKETKLYAKGWTTWRLASSFILDGVETRAQIDLMIYEPNDKILGARLMHHTGSKWENIRLRGIAQEKGWVLSQNGLFDEAGKLLVSSTEELIYHALGQEYKKPRERN